MVAAVVVTASCLSCAPKPSPQGRDAPLPGGGALVTVLIDSKWRPGDLSLGFSAGRIVPAQGSMVPITMDQLADWIKACAQEKPGGGAIEITVWNGVPELERSLTWKEVPQAIAKIRAAGRAARIGPRRIVVRIHSEILREEYRRYGFAVDK